MSELELKNIVGFKAVDAEGNEQQVTVDEMAELVSARIVSAASEISTFAATAAAGTDEFEDQLSVSDTFSWLRTMDGSKNPTLTSSSAAAKVLGELIPLATTTKSGLIEHKIMRDRMQCVAFGSGIIYKLGNLTANYVGIILNGADIVYGKIIDICIFKNSSGIVKAAGNNESWINLKADSDKNIYIMVPLGRIYYASVESFSNYVVDSKISRVDSFPSDAIDITFT